MAETIAFLFSDLQGSTRLLSALGAERYGDVLTEYRAAVEQAAAAEGGSVVDREGDGLFLVFPTAVAALRAAHRAQRAIAERVWPHDTRLLARMGIHAGQAERRDDGWVGLAVHRASRVAAAAHGGQVLVSEAARALAADEMPAQVSLRDLGEHRLKDLERREHLYQLSGPGLGSEFPPLRTLESVPNNLPIQPTSFIGRDSELREVVRLLADERLVTLAGVGGAGKSRLAFQAAAGRLGAQPDGVWVVELGALTEPAGVVGKVAATLGIREDESRTGPSALRDGLVDHLAPRDLLLVLDNCEHLLGEVSALADLLLRSCPAVRILATSRENLGIAGETIWRVPSLSLPEDDNAAWQTSDAVRLFVERARAVGQSFVPSADLLPLVVQVCRRLDGIPLAIELAAARTRVLAVDELAARLDDRFRILTGGSRTALPRQQTLEATIDWSYQLLSEAERTLFIRLSVFSGSFTLAAAEEVCVGGVVAEANVLELVSHLVDKSLVSPFDGPSGPARYRLLETLRQYARTKLAESGGGESSRERHRDRYARLGARLRDGLLGPARLAWLEELEREHDNVRAALDWTVTGPAGEDASSLAAALATDSHEHGQYRRAVERWQVALDQAPTGDAAWEAELRIGLARDLFSTGEAAAALTEAERAVALVGDDASHTRVRALALSSALVRLSTTRAAAEAVLPARQAVAAAREHGDPSALALALRALGPALAWSGEIDEGVAHLREALELARQADDRVGISAAFGGLFHAVHDLGHREAEAERLTAEMTAWLGSVSDRTGWSFEEWGFVAYFHLRRGDWVEVETVLERLGERGYLEGIDRGWLLQIRGALRWMQGRLPEAETDARELQGLGIARWNHDLYPLLAEIAAAQGRLDDVRAAADEYLALAVDPTEEAMKVAVLAPLVRVEVDAALSSTGDERAEYLRRAHEAVGRAHGLLERFPPAFRGALQFEAPAIQLLLANAELTRAVGPDPEAWRRVTEEAWYAYTRLYARWRLGEAHLARGELDAARQELSLAHREAQRRGARFVARAVETLEPRPPHRAMPA